MILLLKEARKKRDRRELRKALPSWACHLAGGSIAGQSLSAALSGSMKWAHGKRGTLLLCQRSGCRGDGSCPRLHIFQGRG